MSVEADQTFVHELPIQVRFNDLDGIGHVNNAVYISYFELGKIEYLDLVLPDKNDWKKTGLITANNNINYINQTGLKDKVRVLTKISRIGTKSVTFYQRLVDENGIIKADKTSVLVVFDFDQDVTMPVPDTWRKAISEYEGEKELYSSSK